MAAHLTSLLVLLCTLGLLEVLFTGSNACGDPRHLLETSAPSFSYDENDPTGPSHWGSLSPDWTTCGTGKAQSPIALVNLSEKRKGIRSHLGPLKFQYQSEKQKATLRTNKLAIEVDVQEGWGRIRVENEYYHFSNFHFHAPSEHTIDKVRYDLELHIVHKSKDDTNIAVLGILFKVGKKRSNFLKQFWSHLPSTVQPNTTSEAKVRMKGLDIEKKTKYWRYKGSLTSPPCAEGVTWTVLKDVDTMSKKQMAHFLEASPKHNARPLQKLNGRKVTSYDG